MPDDLYHRDALAWSAEQADLLRRVARGEAVNGIDWGNVVEEIEDVGRSELHAVESLLTNIAAHLLKLRAWPGADAERHWRSEIAAFQAQARRRFAPSMRRAIDLDGLYADARIEVDLLRDPAQPGIPALAACPVDLDALLNDGIDALETAFRAD